MINRVSRLSMITLISINFSFSLQISSFETISSDNFSSFSNFVSRFISKTKTQWLEYGNQLPFCHKSFSIGSSISHIIIMCSFYRARLNNKEKKWSFLVDVRIKKLIPLNQFHFNETKTKWGHIQWKLSNRFKE